MKTLGIIGGIAPASTIEYYRLIVATYRARQPDGSGPPVIINSIDLQTMLRLIAADALDELVAYLTAEVEKLAQAGCEIGLFASNPPHIVFDALQRHSPIPLISIVDATYDGAHAMGLRRVGLLGTRFTMQGTAYPKVFTPRGIAVIVPEEADLEYVHARYMGELARGEFRDETRRGMLDVIARLRERQGVDAVVLGGTELPLLLRDVGDVGVPLLDTGRIHVEAAVERMLS